MNTHEQLRLEDFIRELRADASNTRSKDMAYARGLEDCADSLEEALTGMGDGWIPVNGTTFPPPETTVLLCTEGGRVEPGYWDAADEEEVWYALDSRWTLRNVTHWQPMPNGPKI